MKQCPLCATDYPSHRTNCEKDGAILIENRDLEPGTVIRGKYRIERLLGRGGMGTVYLAEHLLLGRMRALKFMSSELSQDAKFLKRFRQEALAAIELRHPNVVEVVDLDQAEDGSPYIAMEYVDGPDLRRALAGGPFLVGRALGIARGVALGLGVAHAKGIVLRDVKPENILLAGGNDKPETPKLLDFGISALKENAAAVSHTRGLMLTPEYAAPEQWRGMAAEELDGRTDLYALGGVLYEMLTGKTCFHTHSTEGWMYQHLQEQPQAPCLLRPELANWPGLDELVLSLLEKDRDKRPKDAAEVVALLDAVRFKTPSVRQKTVVEERPATVFENPIRPDPRPMTRPEQRSGTPEQQHLPEEKEAEAETPPRNGRKRVGIIVAALLIVALAGWFAWIVWGSHAAEPSAAGQNAGIEDFPASAYPVDRPNQSETVEIRKVSPGYFEVTRWKMISGRYFAPADEQAGSPPVIVISESAARRWWPGQSAVGQSMRINNQRDWLVVGVAADAEGQPQAVWQESQGRMIYVPQAQNVGDGQNSAGDAPQKQAAPVAPKASGEDPMSSNDPEYLYQKGGTVYHKTLNEDLAFRLWDKSCTLGNGKACREAGSSLDRRLGALSHDKSNPYYQKGCNAGDPESCEFLSGRYEDGDGLPKDDVKAFALYKKACDMNYADACEGVGHHYEVGMGTAKDSQQAAAYYKRSCDGGAAIGCLYWGYRLEMGDGVKQDLGKAKVAYQKACNAKDGFPQACASLKQDKFK